MSRLYAEYGPVVRLARETNRPLFFTSEHDDVSTVFVFGSDATRTLLTDLETFENRRPPGPDVPVYRRLSTNLFFLNGARHRQQKALMRPWFTRRHLERYHDDIVETTRSRLDAWRDRETIHLDEEMNRITLETSSRTLYGIEVGGGERHLARQMAEMIALLFSPATMIPLDLPGTPLRRVIRKMQSIEAALWQEIEAKKRADFEGRDILTSLAQVHFESPEELTSDEIIGEAFTVFFAGHDTASKALVWTLFLIAQHPEVARQLHAELDRELGGEAPRFEQVFGLPTLDRVIKESLRLLTPAVVFAREATRTTSLGGYEIPRGSELLYSPYVLHRDPAIWERPRCFEPDRWLEIKPGPYE